MSADINTSLNEETINDKGNDGDSSDDNSARIAAFQSAWSSILIPAGAEEDASAITSAHVHAARERALALAGASVKAGLADFTIFNTLAKAADIPAIAQELANNLIMPGATPASITKSAITGDDL